MNKNNLDLLIHWLEELQRGNHSVVVPFELHELVQLFYNNLGTSKSIELLNKLKNVKW